MPLGRRAKKFTIRRRLIPEGKFGAAVGALRLAGRLYRQVDPGVRIPQTHFRQGAVQGQIFSFNIVTALCVGRLFGRRVTCLGFFSRHSIIP